MGAIPNYFGIWKQPSGKQGVFFMYIDKRVETVLKEDGIPVYEISGTIVDKLGLSGFEGEITSQNIRFVKQYKIDVDEGATDRLIEFKGDLIAGIYRGDYKISGESDKGRFTLEKLPHSETLQAIADNLMEKVELKKSKLHTEHLSLF